MGVFFSPPPVSLYYHSLVIFKLDFLHAVCKCVRDEVKQEKMQLWAQGPAPHYPHPSELPRPEPHDQTAFLFQLSSSTPSTIVSIPATSWWDIGTQLQNLITKAVVIVMTQLLRV